MKKRNLCAMIVRVLIRTRTTGIKFRVRRMTKRNCQRFLDGLTEIFRLLSGIDNCEIAAPNCSILSTTCGGICLKTSRLLCARSSEEMIFDDGGDDDIETT